MAGKRKIFICLLIFTLFCVMSQAVAADELEGTYFVRGWNQGVYSDEESYVGTVTIRRIGEVYQLGWTIGNQYHGGVGFYYEDSKRLVVAWANLSQNNFGEV